MPKRTPEPKLDSLLGKFVSRKFLVYISCLVLLILGYLGVSEFMIIAVSYIGTEGVIDTFNNRTKSSSSEEA